MSCTFLYFKLLKNIEPCSEAVTDNRSRTANNIKSIINESGGSFSQVLYQFTRKGTLMVRSNSKNFDEILEYAIKIGAEDVEQLDDETVQVVDDPNED